VLETAEPRDLTRVVARALIDKGAALGSLGRKREGIALIEAAERIAREHGYNDELLGAIIVGGFQKGDMDLVGALAAYRDGAALARRIGHRSRLLSLVNNLGYTAFLAGDWDAALTEMESALAEELDAKDRLQLACNAAIVHACRGEPIEAALEEARRFEAANPNEAWAHVHLDPEGNLALAEDRLADARRAWKRLAQLEPSQPVEFLYRAAVAALWAGDREAVASDLAEIVASGFHGRVNDARRLTIRAGVAALDGQPDEAVALYRDALGAWRDLRGVWDEVLTGITMARLLDPSLPEVRRAAESTREILVRLRAKPFIDQLDAARAPLPREGPELKPARATEDVAAS
jgi:tetratricopeptide (TPR) repeat protein